MANGSFDIFLKLDGIEGESEAKGHEKEMVVLSYEQAIEHPGGSPVGGGGAAGKTVFSGVRFRKPLDKGSVPLLLACASGLHVKEALFTFRRAGTAVDFYKVRLEDVVVTRIVQRAGTGVQYPLSFDTLTTGADSAGFLDEATVDYAKIQWEYRTFGADGKLTGTVTGGWDLRLNKKI